MSKAPQDILKVGGPYGPVRITRRALMENLPLFPVPFAMERIKAIYAVADRRARRKRIAARAFAWFTFVASFAGPVAVYVWRTR